MKLAEVRKGLAAVAAAAAQVIALGVLHGAALHGVQVGAAVVGAVLVYLVPNGSKSQAPAHVPEHAA